jgi:two-component system response regulator AlgR
VKVLLVDDEALARERLERLLGDLAPGARCLHAADGEAALAVAEADSPDLVLLDIRMPGMDGIEVAARLEKTDNPPAIIFCTAYDEYALQALQHQAAAYLLKPVRAHELERALAGAGRVNRVQLAVLREGLAGGRRRITTTTSRGVETLALDDVRCFLAEDKYVTACAPGVELVITESLRDLEREFGDVLLRVHRNALVAPGYIVALQRDDEGGWHLELEGVERRPQVSRRHLRAVRERLTAR